MTPVRATPALAIAIVTALPTKVIAVVAKVSEVEGSVENQGTSVLSLNVTFPRAFYTPSVVGRPNHRKVLSW